MGIFGLLHVIRLFRWLVALVVLLPITVAAAEMNVMGPLLIGSLTQPGQATDHEWQDFKRQLTILKKNGVHAVSTDIWWGLVEGERPGVYSWDYYHRVAQIIQDVGLKWIPILSFHKLGGNQGDQGLQNIPSWVWSRYKLDPERYSSADDMKFKSEYGQLSDESVSVWASDLILPDLRRFMVNFEIQFQSYAPMIAEINISLGPAGELRYPSYNQHDNTTENRSGYDTRGALQAYSTPAMSSFQEFVRLKYQTVDNLNRAWGFTLSTFAEVRPPDPALLQNKFWTYREHFSAYGKDFFDWYNLSLVLHGRKILTAAARIFGRAESSMKRVQLGAKIPGIHWRVGSDRAAELAAGLIRTSYTNWYSEESGFGYDGLLSAFKPFFENMRFALHFTALEMFDGHDGFATNKPKTLVSWMSRAIKRHGLEIKGENALSGTLGYSGAWDNLFEALTVQGYAGVTLLRSNEIVYEQKRVAYLQQLSARVGQFLSQHTCQSLLEQESYSSR